MRTNITVWERVLRILIGLFMGFGPLFSGLNVFDIAAVSLTIMFVGVVLLITGVIGICPMYRKFNGQGDRSC
jgi:hypothetical protein